MMTKTYTAIAGLALLFAAGASPAQAALTANGIYLNGIYLNGLRINALPAHALPSNALKTNGSKQRGLADLARQPIGTWAETVGADRLVPQERAVPSESVEISQQPPVKE